MAHGKAVAGRRGASLERELGVNECEFERGFAAVRLDCDETWAGVAAAREQRSVGAHLAGVFVAPRCGVAGPERGAAGEEMSFRKKGETGRRLSRERERVREEQPRVATLRRLAYERECTGQYER